MDSWLTFTSDIFLVVASLVHLQPILAIQKHHDYKVICSGIMQTRKWCSGALKACHFLALRVCLNMQSSEKAFV